MTTTMKQLAFLAGVAAIGAAPLAVADEGPTAQTLAENCAGCHGTDGVSAGPAIPIIAGMSSDYFVEIMKGYKEGTAPSTIMGRLAKGYSEDEIAKMAGYFQEKKFVPAKQKFDAKMVKQGDKLHEKYCEKCHENGGVVPKDKSEEYHILAGQWTPYLRWQMADFHSGVREMPKKMKQKFDKMVEKNAQENIDAVLNYYASQQ